MKPTKKDVARQFGRMSEAYAESRDHAGTPDLDVMVRLLEPQPDWRVLDIATGAGHTAAAVAPHVREVVAIDLAPEMLARTRELAARRGLRNITPRLMDVERLDFPDASFDAVTVRAAPHHFLDLPRALREIARVLRPGGRLVLNDSIAPDDPLLDAFLNGIERLRDPTHVRSYTEREWRAMLEVAGLRVAHAETYRKVHDIDAWLDRAGTRPHVRDEVLAGFSAASPAARSHFAIVVRGGRPVQFTDDKLIVRADKGSPVTPAIG